MLNKRKIFNDPVYGFVTVPNELIFDIIEHQYFQRLRRIKQLGLTHLVYPGALHTRFQHSIGAMHLMIKAINELKFKGHDISDEESLGVYIAILLHDIGHGPYSHSLEHSIVVGINHEQISRIFMDRLNCSFNGKLDIALSIFKGEYKKKFLHKLVSGQFDMDRLDYLKRDSFFTGVSEGIVNYERLLNMLNVVDDELVIEAKGIYSVEKFIAARRLMYWQVYLHKTVLVAEFTIMKVLKRAKQLRLNGIELFATPAFDFFLRNKITINEFENNREVLENFTRLDDYDIFTSMKVWTTHSDPILSRLSSSIINRRLPKVEIQNEPFDNEFVENIKKETMLELKLEEDEIDYFVINDKTSNFTYKIGTDKIGILNKNGMVMDIAEASDQLNISLLSKPTTKYFLCYPKEIN
ncbi:MAG TPA: HD domain-containing protein [Bacteroidales bacterium]|nr:HD domain-containing protein [Bacteroidales bacterium]